MKKPVTIFWFRRDLRLSDNTGLYQALLQNERVLPLFIFDTAILRDLDQDDPRVSFIYDIVIKLKDELEKLGTSMIVKHGKPVEVFLELSRTYSITAVYKNHDYEPYSTGRDQELALWFRKQGIGFHTFKDQVIFEKDEIVKKDGKPYVVFTPYMKAWKQRYGITRIQIRDFDSVKGSLADSEPMDLPAIEEMGFRKVAYDVPEARLDDNTLSGYNETRDYPAADKTTRLSVHLRFGTLSIRNVAQRAARLNETLLNELIWREFYMMILWHFPFVAERSFKPAYDRIPWKNGEKDFEAWCRGMTGFPLVDAGMRQLNETGYMHNRVRMITASFLVKLLLIDWRWGEAFFAAKLMDFELSSNNGGWQWVAGSGCDAAPYFRIFFFSSQAKKFDPENEYIRRWMPETGIASYPKPIIDYKEARQRALLAYKNALK